MSPETQAALNSGRPLNKTQFREYIEAEAKAAHISGGADGAIRRAKQGKEPLNYREMRLRLSISTYLQTK
jgi:hypothetical protein